VADLQVEEPSRPTKVVHQVHTRIHREDEGYQIAQDKVPVSFEAGVTTGRHLHKGGKAVLGSDTIPVQRSLLPGNIWHSNAQRIFSISIANLFMGHMENKLWRRRLFSRVWVRYVGDVFAKVHKDEVLDLLILLNSQHESIKITYEMEEDGKLPFLDVEVIAKNDNTGLLFKSIASLPTQSGSSSTHLTTPSNT
jgi:hypothetical protein